MENKNESYKCILEPRGRLLPDPRGKVIEIHRQKLIMLEVKNPQHYIDKQTSGFKRKMMQMNFNMYGTPLSITSNSLKIKFDELLKILNDQLQESRQ